MQKPTKKNLWKYFKWKSRKQNSVRLSTLHHINLPAMQKIRIKFTVQKSGTNILILIYTKGGFFSFPYCSEFCPFLPNFERIFHLFRMLLANFEKI